MSRLVGRTLCVLGGTIAATALGWLLSSATASADTLPDLSVPGTHAAPVAAPDVTGVLGGVDRTVGVPTLPPPPAVTTALTGAMTQLDRHVPVGGDVAVTPPAAAWPAMPPQAPTAVPAAAGRSGPPIDRAAARSITAATAVAPIPPGPATVVRPVPHPAGAPATGSFTLPGPPAAPAPWSPVTVPAAPGGSVGGGAPGGAGPVVDASGVLPATVLDTVCLAPVRVPTRRVPAGKQPGITPD